MNLLRVTMVLAMLVFLFCQGSVHAQTEDVVRLYIWENYVPEDVIKRFEEKSGITVFVDTFKSEDEMLGVIQSNIGRYDLIIAESNMISELNAVKQLSDIDVSQIENSKNIDTKWFDFTGITPSMGVPYMWGTTGIAYNKKYISKPDKSWSLLWNKKNKGKIGLLNDMNEIMESALKVSGFSINTKDVKEIELARKKVLEQSLLVYGYKNTETLQKLLVDEVLWAAQLYSGDALSLVLENDSIDFFIPEEGANIWVDFFAVLRHAPNPRAAHAFLNHILEPQESATCVNYAWYPSCVSAAKKYVDSELLKQECVYLLQEQFEKCEFRNVSEFRRTAESLQVRKIYNKTWADLQLAVGGNENDI